MSVARITEISSSSHKSFDDAIRIGIKRAKETLHHIHGAWVEDQELTLKEGDIDEYRVKMKVTFVLDEDKH